MNEELKTGITVAAVAFFVAGLALLSIAAGMKDTIAWTIPVFGILVIFVLARALYVKREKARIKEGFPKDDERTRSMKERAGYYAYLGSVYFALGLMWINFLMPDMFHLPELDVTLVLAAVIAEAFVIYLFSWWYFERKAER